MRRLLASEQTDIDKVANYINGLSKEELEKIFKGLSYLFENLNKKYPDDDEFGSAIQRDLDEASDSFFDYFLLEILDKKDLPDDVDEAIDRLLAEDNDRVLTDSDFNKIKKQVWTKSFTEEYLNGIYKGLRN